MKDLLDFEVRRDLDGYVLEHGTHNIEVRVRDTAINEHALEAFIQAYIRAYYKKIRAQMVMTRSQKDVYDYILNFWRKEGRQPTYQEMADDMGKNSKGTPWHSVQALLAQGWVWQDESGSIIPIDFALPEYTD